MRSKGANVTVVAAQNVLYDADKHQVQYKSGGQNSPLLGYRLRQRPT